MTSLKTNLHPYKPSGAKDDSAIYGLGQSINYDDILLVREAFSENDAFSMSDASEVSLGDFAFDDVLLMKEEEEVVKTVPSQTPDILELSDEIIDAYLMMEEDQLRREDEIDCDILPEVTEIRGRSNSELEFWSMSLRDDNVMTTSVELPHLMPSLEDLDLDREPVLLQARDGILKSSHQDVNFDDSPRSPTIYHPITLGKYSTGKVDFMSSVVEDALESLCSEDDEDDDEFERDDIEFYGDDEDEEVDVTLTEERCQSRKLPDEVSNDDDLAAGNLVFAMEDLDESVIAPSPQPAKHLSQSLPVTYRSMNFGEIPTHDYPASYPSQPVSNTWSHPSVTIAKSPPQKKGFFPSHTNCFLPNPFEDFRTSSPLKKERRSQTNASTEFHKLRRRLSQVSCTPNEEVIKKQQKQSSSLPQDNLLKITDMSLSHMFESLDFATELTHSLMPGTHHTRDGADSPLEFPLLENFEDSDCESFSESNDDSEREDPVQTWINNNMPTPPQIIPLEIPPELTFTPAYNLDVSIEEIPTHDLPSLPVCDHNEVHLQREVPGMLFTLACDPELGIDQAQETDGFLKSLSAEKEVNLGLCADSEQVEMADEEVTSEPVQQEMMTNSHTAVHACSNVHPVSDNVCNGEVSGGKSRVESSRDLREIKERLRREIMEQSNKKQAYFTYVSQLAEVCADDTELGQILGEFNHQKCCLWSIGGTLDQPQQHHNGAQDNTDILNNSWMELASQCSDDTDKLLEASSCLVEELERGSCMQAKPLPEDEIGRWRDVIILWLNEQSSDPRVDDIVTGHDVTADSDVILDADDVTADNVIVCGSRIEKDAKAEKTCEQGNDTFRLSENDDGIVSDSNLQDMSEDVVDCHDFISSPWSPSSDLIDSGNFSADGILDVSTFKKKIVSLIFFEVWRIAISLLCMGFQIYM